MGRYSKTHSNYILRGKHQTINGGTIWERDFSTIGERHNIAPGKRRYYFDGNMLFTINNTSLIQNRQKPGNWLCSYTYSNINTLPDDINNVKINQKSNNLCNFAYYGSATDLVRSSIENIIKEFPGSIVNQPDKKVYTYTTDLNGNSFPELVKMDGKDLFQMHNPFNINIYEIDPNIEKYDNELRYLSINWNNYIIKYNDRIENIIKYNVDGVYYTGCIWDESYQCIANVHLTTKYKDANGEDTPGYLDLYVYLINEEYVVCTTINENFEIRPKQEIIEEYFNNIDSFESLLLNRKTNPLYTNNFVTPYLSNNGTYHYPLRTYTWPKVSHSDYCIDITSNTYIQYISELYDLGNKLDEIKADNIWRCMTHESIKYFDWTYTREINEELENSFFEGGERVKSIIRLTGRVFDDVKRMIDSITFTNNVTYNGFNNVPDAELSDKVELNGWDVITTSWSGCDNNFSSNESDLLTEKFLFSNINKRGRNVPLINKISPWIKGHGDNTIDNSATRFIHDKWYSGLNFNGINKNSIDVELMRRLYLSSRRILQSKGTEQSIEMILGLFGLENNIDYKITERYHKLKALPYNEPYYFYEQCLPEESDVPNYVKHNNVPYCYDINSNSDKKIYTDDGIDKKFYTLEKVDTVKSAVEHIMESRMELHYYEDTPFIGVPLNTYLIGNKEYLIPYFDRKQNYDGNFYFQSKGGWGKGSLGDNYDYLETVPYLKVVRDIESLLNQDCNSLSGDDIVYVNNLSDYLNYRKNIPNDISHFFKLINQNEYDNFDGWNYIPMSGDITTIITYNRDGITHDDYLKAKYLDNIVSTSFGNNPHTGYGNYDLGKEYIDYMSEPFRYMINNGDFLNDTYDSANALRYKIENVDTNDKIIINKPYTLIENEPLGIKWNNTSYTEINYEDLPEDEQLKFDDDNYHTFLHFSDFVEDSGFNYIRILLYGYNELVNFTYEDYVLKNNWITHDYEYINNVDYDSDNFIRISNDKNYIEVEDPAHFGWLDEHFNLVSNLNDTDEDKVKIKVNGNITYYKRNDYKLYEKVISGTKYYEKNKVRNVFNTVPGVIFENSSNYIKVVDGDEVKYYELNDNYYLNDKTLIIENLIQSDVYKTYFLNFISHYLMQVIPSTTLLIYKNFNLGVDVTNTYVINCKVDESMPTAGHVSGGGTYPDGTVVEITARPSKGYDFERWTLLSTGEEINTPKYSFTVNNDETYTAHFKRGPKVTLNAIGNGKVAGGGYYTSGSTVEVTSYANSGYKFVGWFKDINDTTPISTSSTYKFKIYNDCELWAKFDTGLFTFTVNGNNMGEINVYDGDYRPVSGSEIITEVVGGVGGEIRISSNETVNENLITIVSDGGGEIRVSENETVNENLITSVSDGIGEIRVSSRKL